MTDTTTHVLVVTDMSGSMNPLAKDVRGGFNAYVADLRSDPQPQRYRLSLTVFDTVFESLCSDAGLDQVPELTEGNYQPRGMTALLDAVGKTIAEFEAKHPSLGDDERVLLVIQTDGCENSSQEFTWETVRELLRVREATGKWSIVYLGQGVDAWAQGVKFGPATQSVHTFATGEGTRSSYSGLASATRSYAAGGSSRDVGATIVATPGVGPDAPES